MTTITVSVKTENISHGDANVESDAAAFHVHYFRSCRAVGNSEMFSTAVKKQGQTMRKDSKIQYKQCSSIQISTNCCISYDSFLACTHMSATTATIANQFCANPAADTKQLCLYTEYNVAEDKNAISKTTYSSRLNDICTTILCLVYQRQCLQSRQRR